MTDELREWNEQRGALAAALAKAQGAFPPITRGQEADMGTFKYKYASLDVVLAAVRKPLSDNGLALVQLLDGPDLVTMLLHSSGGTIEGRVIVPRPERGTIQQLGSAITYLRRYALQAMLGIAAEEDDDGSAANKAGGNGRAERDALVDAAKERMGIASGPPAVGFNLAASYDAGLIGVAKKGTADADFELRQAQDENHPEPTPRLAFRLTEGAAKLKVVAWGVVAELISEYRAGIEDQRVTAWGSVGEESFTPANARRPVAYAVLTLTRLKVGTLDLSAPDPESGRVPTAEEEEEMAQLAFGEPVPA